MEAVLPWRRGTSLPLLPSGIECYVDKYGTGYDKPRLVRPPRRQHVALSTARGATSPGVYGFRRKHAGCGTKR